MNIKELVKEAHENALNHGWWEGQERPISEQIALMHSELSEALEELRSGKSPAETYYKGEKPCGVPSELADVVIRIADTCGRYGIDLDTAICEKMEYNKNRPYRHGGKKF